MMCPQSHNQVSPQQQAMLPTRTRPGLMVDDDDEPDVDDGLDDLER
ncbi:MAG: hypothetical protein QOC63_4787 [Mycobacterium sp.]|nr:hypothetical protein [Mycobacterium sp.]